MGQPVAIVNIVLQSSSVTRAGFGTQIFIASHNQFPERVRLYQSISGVAEDFPEDSPVYAAAQSAFNNNPKITQFKVGRRASSSTLTPVVQEDGGTYSFTVDANGLSATLTFTTATTSTATAIATGLVADLGSSDPIKDYVSISASADTVVVSGIAGAVFTVSDLDNLTSVSESTETASEVLNAIREEDDDFYFVAAEDHTSQFQQDMALAIQSTEKVYFTSSQDPANYTTYGDLSTDSFALLHKGNFTRTISFYHHLADTRFPETTFISMGAVTAPDQQAITWFGQMLEGLPVSLNTSGKPLTATQRNNLDARNANYLWNTSAGVRTAEAKTSSGRWIDDQITMDCMTARVREGIEGLILNQPMSKVPANDDGLAMIKSAISFELEKFKRAGTIDSYDVFTENAVIDPQTRVCTGIVFDAYLSGAIHRVIINGTLIPAGAV